MDTLSTSEKATLTRDSIAYDKELSERNCYITSEALERKARTVRVRRGKASVTDGPFAETKEVVGGFILTDAAGMDQAIEIAAGILLAKLGSIEVRPIMQMRP